MAKVSHHSRAASAPAAPGLLRLALEMRAPWELGIALASYPWIQKAPAGDGHPVLVFPGLAAGDTTTLMLRRYLKDLGYPAYAWEQGLNFGPRPGVLEACLAQVEQLHARHGKRVSLVGWSLGGVFSLYGAHQAPECVRNVITLGSPISVDAEGSCSPPLVKALYRLIAHPLGPDAHALLPSAKRLRERKRLAVPMSCLYSLGDGIVPPQEATLDGDPARHENIRVLGSHTGLGFNAMALAIVADRLAQREDAWQPFKPRGWWGDAYRWATRGGDVPH